MSDTHGYLNPALFHFFENCDEVWHAGDWGPGVLEQWNGFKPIKGVYGNIDGAEIRKEFKEDLSFAYEGLTFFMTHIAGYPGHYAPAFRKKIAIYKPDVVICGHSHILRVMKDTTHNFMLINPGACGNHGFQKVNTAIRFNIENNRLTQMELWEQKRK